ncbi:MAG: leucyl/phenylalanyl-tRNA--protein transferase [Bacteroidota bacterium]
MPVFWLTEELSFPSPELANEDGILAVGGDLSTDRLLLAYSMGLFPWFNPDDPILWWSPDPRFVLYPDKLKVSKSMRPYFNQKKFTVTFDTHFQEVMTMCQQQYRKGQYGGTWISDEMIVSYTQLNKMGFAHSVEVWQDHNIVGGLYGISLGKIFFGESMFTTVSNASKFGFITLVKKLEELGYWLIDCQQRTKHLESLGGEYIQRREFQKYMDKNKFEKTLRGNWGSMLENKPKENLTNDSGAT